MIEFITRYCVTPEGKDVGKPMVLADFQKKFILDVYDNPHGTRRAVLSCGRKNGKSGLISALLVGHILGPAARRGSMIAAGAMSREQAGIIFRLASQMIQLSPVLAPLAKIIPSSKKIIGLPMGVEFRAVSAEAKTAHGLSSPLILLDEAGQEDGPTNDFFEALTSCQGAWDNPLQLIISTQASHDSAWLSTIIDDALSGNDPRTVCHLYTAPEDCDLLDESAWKAANPALDLFRSRDDLAEQLKQAARMPSMAQHARWLLLNQRVATDSPFIAADVWKACNAEPLPFDGPVYAGLDLSARTDLTALVLVGKVGDSWQVRPYFWTPEQGLHERAKRDRTPYPTWVEQGFLKVTPGSTVDYAHVIADMKQILEGLTLESIGFDRWRIDVFRRELERSDLDLPLVPHGQGFKDFTSALEALEAELLNGRMRHGGHPVLTMCAANACVTSDAAAGRKLDKSRKTGRIDGLVALAMAMNVAVTSEREREALAEEFVYL